MQKLFDEIKKKEISKIMEKKNSSGQKRESDPRFVNFGLVMKDGKKSSCTYKFRLLFAIPEGSKRKHPFIIKNIHHGVDEKGDYAWVTCPTSEYLLGETNEGFRACPVCDECNKLYIEEKKGKVSATELYKKIRRGYYMFAPVFVVNDPVKPENNGKIMIGKFPKTIGIAVTRAIFGVDPKTKEEVNPEEIVGFDAFDVQNGYDMIVNVSPKTEIYKDYAVQFARNRSSINITDEQVMKAIIDLKFDQDFLTDYNTEDLYRFIKNNVLNKIQDKEDEGEIDTGPSPAPSVTSVLTSEVNSSPAVSQVVEQTPLISTSAPTAISNTPAPSDDIDKLIADIEKDYSA